METDNKDKKVGVFMYEFLGTAFIMYALILSDGLFSNTSVLATNFAMMVVAYNVSGGHFNPAISVGMFVANKQFGKDLFPLLLMVGGQFAGAFFGILLGFLAVIASQYQSEQSELGQSSHANVPSPRWVNFEAFLPKQANKKDFDTGLTYDHKTDTWSNDDWTRDWQCFMVIFMCSIILVMSYISIKHKDTQLTDNSLIQIIAIQVVIGGIVILSNNFGGCGWNPALATAYISFAVSQYAYPNIMYDAEYKQEYGFDPSDTQVNHYLWVYLTAPFAGGLIAGILHLIHNKCASSKDKDNNVSTADLVE